MRILPLEGSKAQYERLKLLGSSNTYGMVLDPEETQPFLVQWFPLMNRALITYRQTQVASINAADSELHIRDGFPEECDFALLRALRNAVTLTDEIGRLQREEKGKTKSVLTNQGHEVFRLSGWSPETLFRAIYGMTGKNSHLIPQAFVPGNELPGQLSLRIRSGVVKLSTYAEFAMRSTSQVTFHKDGADLECRPSGYATYHLKGEAFQELLQAGLAHWDATMTEAAVTAACQKLVSSTHADKQTINGHWDFVRSADKGKSIKLDVVASSGGLTGNVEGDFRYRGILLGTPDTVRSQHGEPKFVATPAALHIGVNPDLLKAAMQAMSLRVRAAMMGRTVEDYPTVKARDMRDLIDSIDYGYDM